MSESDTLPTSAQPGAGPASPPGTARPLLFLAMAVCSAATVANVYLAQPLLALFADDLGVSSSAAGTVVTCAQLGYAAGILFLVPLGDIRRRRPLLTTMLVCTVLALLAAAAAPGLSVLAASAALVGGATVIPQVLVPLASELAPPQRRASIVANVQIGLMTGIVGSRVIGGLVGEALSWRAMYLLAAVLTALTGAVTVALLPREGARKALPYRQLLGSLPRLLRQEPVLRHSCLMHSALFGAYTATWTTLVFALADEPYGYSSATAGLFGLLGLAGAFAAPWAGRFIDRRAAAPIITVALLLMVVSAGAYWFGGSLIAFMILAVMLANVSVQWSQIANQARIFSYLPEARSRANTVYMVAAFLSGAVAAALGSVCYGAFGWGGACALQAALAAAGLLVVPAMRRHDTHRAPAA
ncbi:MULTISPECIES: MFS transporter [unclassified Streptomyces]|uniref:MFS transporter n=1 Tax=unclassified Streptomyces TaxID=2593676 RepID=UPI000DAB8EB7|nr:MULTISPECIES: MFS transporter [unclassified Streptomyces]PZT74779.1 MFS transporter [Streptomyces sp. AC1-42T]PZT82235.1 MFS transporter [Streptomyces sp. AC1-42W]